MKAVIYYSNTNESLRIAEYLAENLSYPLTDIRNALDNEYSDAVLVFPVHCQNIPDMLKIASTVVMDCTHSVQRPGAAGGKTGGNREFVPAMAQAAKAFGANGFFFEVHPDPDKGLSDGPNMLRLEDLEGVVKSLL